MKKFISCWDDICERRSNGELEAWKGRKKYSERKKKKRIDEQSIKIYRRDNAIDVIKLREYAINLFQLKLCEISIFCIRGGRERERGRDPHTHGPSDNELSETIVHKQCTNMMQANERHEHHKLIIWKVNGKLNSPPEICTKRENSNDHSNCNGRFRAKQIIQFDCRPHVTTCSFPLMERVSYNFTASSGAN